MPPRLYEKDYNRYIEIFNFKNFLHYFSNKKT